MNQLWLTPAEVETVWQTSKPKEAAEMAWREFEQKVADVFRLVDYEVTQDVNLQGGQTELSGVEDSS